MIWPVEILTSERPPRSVRVGVGWGTDDRLRGQLGYAHRNWLGGARHLDARLRFGVRRSTVENPLDARQGTSVDLSVAPFLSTLGSDVSFVSTELRARAFQALGPTVLAGRVRLGSLQPLLGSSTDEIPLPERFYAGGGSSVRGFSFWRLGPREADGRAVGAASVFEGSLELRFPIRGPVGGVVFADAGQLDLTPWRWKPADLTVSLGGGLRIGTPLGPIRFDLAFPLNAPEESKTTFFHFSIGQAF